MAKCGDCLLRSMCFITNAPTSVGCREFIDKNRYVEVVRCKDCKHREDGLCPMESVEQYPWFATKSDGFCSYGERREGE